MWFHGFWIAAAMALLPSQMYEVAGSVTLGDGRPFRGANAVVYLHGAITPFSRQALVGRDGRFRFKRIPSGTYTLIGAVPRVGEVRKTIEVGPSFADAKRTVVVTLTYDQPASVDRRGGISTAELSVSENAKDEYQRAVDTLSRGDVKGAVEHLKKAVEISPQFATAWNHLGTIAYQTRDYQQAETYFREALNQDPDAYPPLVNLGGALIALGRFEESLEVNRSAVKTMPGDALANSQLGKSCFHLGKLDEAETYFKRAKALDASHFSYPQIYLIEVYVRTNRLPAAIAEMEEFLKLHPDSDWVPRIREILANARGRLQAGPGETGPAPR
jgi:Tfp pilus assembly protein PilF